MWRAVRSLILSFVVLVASSGGVPVAALGAGAVSDGAVSDGAVTVSASAAVGGSGAGSGAGPGRTADAPAVRTEPGAAETPTSTPGPRRWDARPRWVWPTASHVVVRPWEAPESEYGPGHRGLDVAAPPGTSVVAVASGTVSFAGSVGGRPVVAVDHGDGLVSTLDAVEPGVVVGDHVEQGDLVGTTAPGHCAEQDPCLHIGARLDGRYVDPASFLPRAAWPVLLPDGAWTPSA